MRDRILHRFVVCLGGIGIAVLVWATFASRGASVRPDELGFLLNGWVLTGHDETFFGAEFRSFYTAGYGFVTAVAAVVGGGIDAQYRLSLLANIGLVVATAAVLSRLAFRHLAVARNTSRTLAIVVALAPAVAANSLFAWSETLNRFLFVAVVLLAYEHATRPRWSTSIPIGVASSYMVIAHGRFTLVPALTVALLVIAATRAPRKLIALTAGGVLAAVVSWWVFTRINVSLRRDLYPAAGGKEGRMVDKLTTPSNLPSLARSAAGQLWYVLATSFGLAAVGLAVNVRSAMLGLRRARNLQWLAPAFLFLSAGTVALASALQLLRVIRPDHLVYGRYLEAVAPVFVLVGLAALVSGSRFARRAWTYGIVGIVACTAALTVAAGRDELRSMIAQNKFFAIPNAIALDWALKLTDPAGYLSLTLVFVFMSLVFFLVSRRNTVAFLATLAVVSLAFTTFTAARTVVPYRDYFDHVTLDNEARARVEGDQRETTIVFDSGGLGGQTFYDYRYLLHPIQVTRADVRWIDREPLRCVIGAVGRPPEDTGWNVVATENENASRGKQEPGNIVLWMRTGVDSC
ncbi:MAG: hypothetical protein RI908_1042 [Actinomycetota bacterium]